MTSTNRTTIPASAFGRKDNTMTTTTISARLRQLVSAALFAASVAIALGAGALADPAIARSEPTNYEKYLDCLKTGASPEKCCIEAGGLIDPQTDQCKPPTPIWHNPGQSTKPPLPPLVDVSEPPLVLQNPPAQPSNPLIPVPRGPNSGTLAP
jgi:hypothetical protein